MLNLVFSCHHPLYSLYTARIPSIKLWEAPSKNLDLATNYFLTKSYPEFHHNLHCLTVKLRQYGFNLQFETLEFSTTCWHLGSYKQYLNL